MLIKPVNVQLTFEALAADDSAYENAYVLTFKFDGKQAPDSEQVAHTLIMALVNVGMRMDITHAEFMRFVVRDLAMVIDANSGDQGCPQA